MRVLSTSAVFIFLFLLFGNGAYANEEILQTIQQNIVELQKSVQFLKTTVASQNEMIRQQAVQIAVLKRGREAFAQQSQVATTSLPAGSPKVAGLSQGFNPDIGVVGTIQAQLTENSQDGEGRDTIALKEIELNFAQYVDPYSRLDAVLSFNDALENQNAAIEEAYYTHWGLPFGFRGQIGKFRAKIGKENLLHLDQLDTVNFPLVIQNFFGEDGLASSGVRLQNWIPNPWDIPLEITGEVLRGNNGTSFSQISRRPIFNTHLKSFFEPTQNTTLELGGTVMFGDENPRLVDAGGNFITKAKGQDRYGVHVVGADATFLWNLPEGRTAKFQNEVYFQDRGSNSSIQTNVNHNPWGFYSLLDVRVSRRWSTGIRFDYLEPLAVINLHERTTAISPYLTFWQSEFANFRIQYSHTEPADANEKSDNAVYLQANVLIGTHKHPVQ